MKILKSIKKEPHKSSRKMAKELGVHRQTIDKQKKEITTVITREIVNMGIIDFFDKYHEASTRTEKLFDELEEIKKKPNESNMNRASIIKMQEQFVMDLMSFISKPKLILSLQNIRNTAQTEILHATPKSK